MIHWFCSTVFIVKLKKIKWFFLFLMKPSKKTPVFLLWLSDFYDTKIKACFSETWELEIRRFLTQGIIGKPFLGNDELIKRRYIRTSNDELIKRRYIRRHKFAYYSTPLGKQKDPITKFWENCSTYLSEFNRENDGIDVFSFTAGCFTIL